MWERLTSFVARLVREEATSPADERERLRLETTVLITVVTVIVSPLWIATYLFLGHPTAAAIPATYLVILLSMLAWLGWRGPSRVFPALVIGQSAFLPVLLQLSLGGFQ